MIRRPVLALGAVLSALSLSACATLTTNDEVASVDGQDLSQDELRLMIDSELGQSLLQDAPVDGFIGGDSARALINAWVQLTALTEAGIASDVDTAPIIAELESTQASWSDAPQIMRDLAVKNVAISTAQQQGGIDQARFVDVLTAADVTIDPRYGWWNPESLAVSALG